MVFKALAVTFRDLFYLYFIKGISLQRTNKRSVPNWNVRNPVLRGYKQISCPAVKRLPLKCSLCFISYPALRPLLPLKVLFFLSQGGRQWGATGDAVPKMDGLLVRGDSWPLGCPDCICHQVCGEEHKPGSSERLLSLSRPCPTGKCWMTVCLIQQLRYRYFEHGFYELLQKEIKLNFGGWRILHLNNFCA